MTFCAVLALLAGCVTIPGFGDGEDLELGTVGYVQGFYGGVAADEPRAVLVGRDVLAAGGTAADAATAVYFMLSVTYPSAAGLGGGGLCLIRDTRSQKIETLDFLGERATGTGSLPVNVPGNPRGFFAMHARFGVLDWGEVIRPAENAARFGVEVSRAFARQLAGAGSSLSRPAREVFAPGGRPLGEGDLLRQENLSTVLAALRSHGGGVLYTGPFARQFAAAAAEDGATLTYRDLQAFLPQWRQAIEVIYSPRTSFFLPLPRTPVGTMAAKALAVAVHDSQFQKADDPLRAHLLAEAIQRALVDGGRGFATVAPVRENRLDYEPEEPRVRLSAAYIEGLSKSIIADRVVRLAAGQASQPPRSSVGGQTSFTVVDRTGNAVACFVTMNRDFGVGTPVRGTGVHLAAPVASTDQRDLSAALLMLARRDKDLLYMAASASGGNTAQAALIQAALRAAGDTPDDMDTAVKWSRLYRDPAAVVTYVEEGAPASIVNGLRQRGHEVRTIAPFGRVNMMFCGTGLPSQAKTPDCAMRSDPRGFGLSTAPSS